MLNFQKYAICLLCFSISFERINLFGLGIDYLSSKIAIVLLITSSLLNYPIFQKSKAAKKIDVPTLYILFYALSNEFLNVNDFSYSYFDLPLLLNIAIFYILYSSRSRFPGIVQAGLFSFSMGVLILFFLQFLGFKWYHLGRAVIGELNSNAIGFYALVSLLFIMYCILDKRVKYYKYRLFLFPLIIPYLQMIFASGSRGSFISIIVGFIILLGFSPMMNKTYKTIFFSVAAYLSVFLWFLYFRDSVLFSRISNVIDANDISARDLIWYKIGDIMMENNFIFGIGKTGYDFFMASSFLLEDSVNSPHNVFLEVFAYTGIFGLIIFGTFIFRVFNDAFKEKNLNGNVLPMTFIMPITIFLLSSQIFNHKIFWILFAFMVLSPTISNKKAGQISRL